MSPARRKNSISAWKMPVAALGRPIDCCATSPPTKVTARTKPAMRQPSGLQPAEEGDDDRGEAVAGRKARHRCAGTGPATSKRAGEPGEAAADQQRQPDRLLARRTRHSRAACGAAPTTRTWKPNTERDITNHATSAHDHRDRHAPVHRRSREQDRQRAGFGEDARLREVPCPSGPSTARRPGSRAAAPRHRSASGEVRISLTVNRVRGRRDRGPGRAAERCPRASSAAGSTARSCRRCAMRDAGRAERRR